MKTDREIYLNEQQKSAIRKAMTDGKKCVIISDLMINIYPINKKLPVYFTVKVGNVKFQITNAHTGDVMKVKNWK